MSGNIHAHIHIHCILAVFKRFAQPFQAHWVSWSHDPPISVYLSCASPILTLSNIFNNLCFTVLLHYAGSPDASADGQRKPVYMMYGWRMKITHVLYFVT